MNERHSFDETVDFASADANMLPHPSANRPHLPHLQLLDEIARGGMGAILKARDLDLGRDLAVKVLLEAHQGKPEMVQRFLEEAQIAGQLQHPGIAPIHELGELPDGRPYFTMKLVKGQTLAALLAARKDVLEDRPRFLGIFAQVCQTVAYAHAHRVIHRDLKPSNIMVGAFGEVQVMDWGLAKVLKEGGRAETSREPQRADLSIISTQRGDSGSAMESGSCTQAGTVLGTPAYMAPEQARGDVEQVDERADVFGLGAILCEILTGQPPYTGTGAEIQYQSRTTKLEDAFARLDACGADTELSDLAKRCLAAELRDRPRYAGEAAEQVTAYQQSVAERLRQAELARAAEEARGIEARATAKQERKARRMTLALAATVLLTVLLGYGSWLWTYSRNAMRLQAMNWAITDALTQAISLRDQARKTQGRMMLVLTAQAREQARRAEALVDSGPADEALVIQVRLLLAQLKADEEDMKLLAALDAARLAQAQTNTEKSLFTMEQAAPFYREAFRAYGMPAGEGEATSAAARLGQCPAAVREAALAALDDWVALAENPTWKINEAHLSWLKAVLAAVDPEGWEKQVRDATADKDAAKRRARLEKLATTADVEHLPARALTHLAIRLQLVQAKASAVTLLRRAQVHHAGDFWINQDLGTMLQKQQPEEAVRYLTVAAALRSDSAGARLNLGNALRNQGKLDEAIASYKKAIAIADNYEQAHTALGIALADSGRQDEAITAYKRAVTVAPQYAPAHDHLGAALSKQGKWDEAAVEFQKAIILDPKFASAHCNLGAALASRGKRDEAVAEYKKAITLDPKLALPHYNLGLALAEQGKHGEAVAEYKKAISLDPKLASAHDSFGTVLSNQGKWAEAAAEFKRAIAIEPKFAHPHSNLAYVLSRQDKRDEAIVEYKKAIELEPRLAWAHNGLGAVLVDQGKWDEAVIEYKKAIHIDSKFAPAYGNLAGILARQGKRDAALAEYRKAVELSPENRALCNDHAALCLVLGDKNAYRRCRRAMLVRFRDTKDPVLAEQTAKICLLLPVADEELKQASALADQAVTAKSSHPLFAYFQMCKGLAEYRNGRLDSAVSWLQKSLSQPIRYWSLTIPAHLVLALAHHRRGQEEQARKSLAAAVRIYDEQHVAASNDKDSWISQILRREAESEIRPNGKKSHHESHQ